MNHKLQFIRDSIQCQKLYEHDIGDDNRGTLTGDCIMFVIENANVSQLVLEKCKN
jgi:hypothetical protein